MIKRFLQILIIAIPFINIATFAQDSVKIDLQAIVKAQMLQAQSSQMITKESTTNDSLTTTESTIYNSVIAKELTTNDSMITKESTTNDSRIMSFLKSSNIAFPKISSTVFNMLILVLSAIIVLALVFLRRVKIQQKIVSKQFKENIRLIREEGLRQPIDHSLTPVRKGLLEKIESCFEDKSITALARKLKIAKGEIYLVNSIKSYGSETSIARNQA